jgi:uncharacterized protein YggU (UPF0235/DUF167 family)
VARITVRLTPHGGRDAIDGWRDDTLLARVSTVPADGAANTSLIRLLAKKLRIAPSTITLVSGAQSPVKTIEIAELPLDEIRSRLGAPG